MKNKIATVGLLVLLVMIAGVAKPPIPEFYHGYAVLNGNLTLNETSVIVEVSGTGEVVGNGTVYNDKGAYNLNILFDDSSTNETDEGAGQGDKLVWKINGMNCTTPAPLNDTAVSGGVNEFYVIGVGEIPLIIADYTPINTSFMLNEGSNQTFTVDVVSAPETNLTYNWTVNGVTNSTNLSYTYVSPLGDSGLKTIRVDASNGTTSDTQEWNVTINKLPVISPVVPNITLESNTIIDFDLTPYETDIESSDTDLFWNVAGDNNLIATVYIDPETDNMTIIPRPDIVAVDYVTLILNDADGGTDTQEIKIVIEPICSGVNPPSSGNWNIYEETVCEDKDIFLSDGSSLDFYHNNTLILKDTEVHIHEINFIEGGELILSGNTTIYLS